MAQKFQLYVLKDLKAETFGPPVHSISQGAMLRSLFQETRKPGTLISDFPADFEVWHVGEFDDKTGVLSSMSERLGNVKTLIEVGSAEPKISVAPGGNNGR